MDDYKYFSSFVVKQAPCSLTLEVEDYNNPNVEVNISFTLRNAELHYGTLPYNTLGCSTQLQNTLRNTMK